MTCIMSRLKEDNVAQLLPPPYEVDAYTYRRPRFERRLRRVWSLPVLLALTVTYAFVYVCLSLGRDAYINVSTADVYGSVFLKTFEESTSLCAAREHFPPDVLPGSRERNPRWNAVRGQNETIALRNATLFDGEMVASTPVDIVFSKGLITSISPASTAESILKNGLEYGLNGRHVTPGLVDMHSHHMTSVWPAVEAVDDGNGAWVILACPY